MQISFRQKARDALSRAKAELATQEKERLKYAALELRMAMECLTYERASSYASELPPAEYETWQPRKLLQMLLEIDPRADKDSSLAVGIEEEYGKPAATMTFLGEEKVLNLGTIKRHYDALGSYLHTPTLKQMNTDGDIDYGRLRGRCEAICAEVEKTLSTPIWNINFGSFAETRCVRCNHVIRKRLNGSKEIARCFECSATYEVVDEPPNKVRWRVIQQTVKCQAEDCGGDIVMIDSDIQPGKSVKCPHCGTAHDIDLVFHLREENAINSSAA